MADRPGNENQADFLFSIGGDFSGLRQALQGTVAALSGFSGQIAGSLGGISNIVESASAKTIASFGKIRDIFRNVQFIPPGLGANIQAALQQASVGFTGFSETVSKVTHEAATDWQELTAVFRTLKILPQDAREPISSIGEAFQLLEQNIQKLRGSNFTPLINQLRELKQQAESDGVEFSHLKLLASSVSAAITEEARKESEARKQAALQAAAIEENTARDRKASLQSIQAAEQQEAAIRKRALEQIKAAELDRKLTIDQVIRSTQELTGLTLNAAQVERLAAAEGESGFKRLAISVQIANEANRRFLLDLRQVRNDLQNLSSQTQFFGIAVAGAFTLAFSEVNRFIIATRELAAETGSTAEDAQRLLGVFREFGVSSERASFAIQQFSRHLEDARNGNKAAQQSLLELGLTQSEITDNSKSFIDVLKLFADKVAAVQDPVERTALVTKEFGRNARELVPIFAQGAKGIEEAFGQQRVVTEQQAEALKKLSIEFENLKTHGLVALADGFSQLAPVLEHGIDLMDQLFKILQDHSVFTGTVLGLAAIAGAGGIVFGVIGHLATGVLALYDIFIRGAGGAQLFAAATDRLTATLARLEVAETAATVSTEALATAESAAGVASEGAAVKLGAFAAISRTATLTLGGFVSQIAGAVSGAVGFVAALNPVTLTLIAVAAALALVTYEMNKNSEAIEKHAQAVATDLSAIARFRQQFKDFNGEELGKNPQALKSAEDALTGYTNRIKEAQDEVAKLRREEDLRRHGYEPSVGTSQEQAEKARIGFLEQEISTFAKVKSTLQEQVTIGKQVADEDRKAKAEQIANLDKTVKAAGESFRERVRLGQVANIEEIENFKKAQLEQLDILGVIGKQKEQLTQQILKETIALEQSFFSDESRAAREAATNVLNERRRSIEDVKLDKQLALTKAQGEASAEAARKELDLQREVNEGHLTEEEAQQRLLKLKEDSLKSDIDLAHQATQIEQEAGKKRIEDNEVALTKLRALEQDALNQAAQAEAINDDKVAREKHERAIELQNQIKEIEQDSRETRRNIAQQGVNEQLQATQKNIQALQLEEAERKRLRDARISSDKQLASLEAAAVGDVVQKARIEAQERLKEFDDFVKKRLSLFRQLGASEAQVTQESIRLSKDRAAIETENARKIEDAQYAQIEALHAIDREEEKLTTNAREKTRIQVEEQIRAFDNFTRKYIEDLQQQGKADSEIEAARRRLAADRQAIVEQGELREQESQISQLEKLLNFLDKTGNLSASTARDIKSQLVEAMKSLGTITADNVDAFEAYSNAIDKVDASLKKLQGDGSKVGDTFKSLNEFLQSPLQLGRAVEFGRGGEGRVVSTGFQPLSQGPAAPGGGATSSLGSALSQQDIVNLLKSVGTIGSVPNVIDTRNQGAATSGRGSNIQNVNINIDGKSAPGTVPGHVADAAKTLTDFALSVSKFNPNLISTFTADSSGGR